ncbi:twitch domain-containing radical SAM protein [Poseidonocella sedimentorum]|uniref:Iron-sulfur cluster-binding domain-containing protein n=1 Tax=Poseidonocella sedimentorum TaxID=871652 RepID=A0A1I6DLF4_9RHOB|nr:twitch domain-containing radical SAM protein [Poseidonocella sedimentorum]SFR06217.1 Iron-sulfur cluster-binding domain-containing protein [Poseidonocella sedimentorum]
MTKRFETEMSAADSAPLCADGATGDIPSQAATSPSWCVLPWTHLFIGETGEFRPCCMSLEQRGEVNRDAEGAPLHAYDDLPLDDIWNSPFMRGIRRDMLSGITPRACARCMRDEKLGLRSHRQASNAGVGDAAIPALIATSQDGAADPAMIRSLDVRLGNRCNLKCRMCSPVSSRAMLSDFAALHGRSPEDPKLQALMGRENWVSSPSFHALFEACASGAEEVQFSGGEPLLIPEMEILLRSLVERGIAGGIALHYISNLTVLPDRFFDYWARFKDVRFLVSLDGTGAVGEYIRTPMRWRTVDKNLRTLNARAAELNCTLPRINVTVQAYNIFDIDRTVTYIAEQLPAFGRPCLSLLYFPEPLGIQILPQDMKAAATERLERLLRRLEGGWPEQWRGAEAEDLKSKIRGIIEHMHASCRADLLDEFRRWTRLLDARRGEDVVQAVPDLAPLFQTGCPPVARPEMEEDARVGHL